MKKEIERLAFLKGFKIGLITSKNNIEVDNYINKLDQEISNIENNTTKEDPILDTTKVETTTKDNTTNMYNLLQHINNKINYYIKIRNKNANNILLLSKNKFNYRYIQYIQIHNIKIINETENLKKIYDIIYNKYMTLLSKPINEESPPNESIIEERNFIYNPTAFINISDSLNNSLNELTENSANRNSENPYSRDPNSENPYSRDPNSQNSDSRDSLPEIRQGESVVQQFNQSINNLTSLIMSD
jgi:hypothetical protein